MDIKFKKPLKFKKPKYESLEDMPVLSDKMGIFDKDPFAMVPNRKTFAVIAMLRKRAFTPGMYDNPEILYGMIVAYLDLATIKYHVDEEGEETDAGIPLSLSSLAKFCGVTYKRLWKIGEKSEVHKELLDIVRAEIEDALEDASSGSKRVNIQGVNNRLKCRYPETWDRNTILAETIGEDTKFNFTIE